MDAVVHVAFKKRRSFAFEKHFPYVLKRKRSKSHEDDEIFSPPSLLILALLFNRCSCQKLDFQIKCQVLGFDHKEQCHQLFIPV